MRIVREKRFAIVAAGLAPIILRLILLPWFPMPRPRVHDEFSHVLVADTFAHGRMVNPVHPMWPHFESMHILVRPVYASIFPVAQGLMMAAGQVVTGRPWSGVVLSCGLMCAALCWMLQGWVPPKWALLGSALVVIRYGLFSYWMNSYFGGALAATGGALVLGVLPRLWKCPRWWHGILLAAGFLILANSRPFEGLLLAAPIVVFLIWKAPPAARRSAIVAPLILVLATGCVAMGVYFARFSGSPFRLPYEFYRSTSAVAPHFVWQSPRPEPVYLHRVLWDFYTQFEMKTYREARANRSPHGVVDKAKAYWRFYLGPFLSLSAIALPMLWKRRRTRALLLFAVLFSAGLVIEVWDARHYAAPALGLVLLLVVEALRHIRVWAGPWPVAVIVAGCIVTPVVGGSGHSTDGSRRAAIEARLNPSERHLVLMRYSRTHDPGDEWVYNRADIDSASVVWAREMDPTSNQRLIRYFTGRRVWLLETDREPPALIPFSEAGPADPPFRFVKLGTPEVEVLWSADAVRRMVQARIRDVCGPAGCELSCDQWNFVFTQVTGVDGPPVMNGCFAGDRASPVTLDHWFSWLEKQP